MADEERDEHAIYRARLFLRKRLAGYLAPGSAVRSIGILPEGIAATTSAAG